MRTNRATKFSARMLEVMLPLLFILLPSAGKAQQTLDIDDGIRIFSTLNGTTVNMAGRSELHVTAGSNPIAGCMINLNSLDAWLFLENIQPSLVISDHLAQIRVNGAPAVLNENVRVVAYVMGTVVIPHPPSYSPLRIFTGSRFSGASMQLGLYTFYTGINLGAMDSGISSFKLKRGYMATFAQRSNGGGISRVYVAQDGDIEVSALPPELSRNIGFVRVFPWKWTGKKGWAGAPQPLVNPLWNYDWDNSATSSPNVEYVPMRHNLHWNAYSNINNKNGSTHALGFNEPDRPDQANMSVATTLAEWPNLMASGLRLGSPATSDGGLNWLYDFIDQADALNYRVDYVAVHYYKGGWTAAQLRDWLLGIHLRTGRPLWVTEWNNGANWTCCAPTLESNAQSIGEFMDVMNQAHFVERYSIYNWVGPNREMVIDNALTPAGIVYRDKISPNSYLQEIPAGAGADARYLMNGDAIDSTGSGNDAMIVGMPKYTQGPFTAQSAIKLDGFHDYVQLPAGLGRGNQFTFGCWVNWDGVAIGADGTDGANGANGANGAGSQRIFDLGDGANRYLYLAANSDDATMRFAITTNGVSGEQHLDGPALVPGVWTHLAVTIDGGIGKLYVNGALVAVRSNMTVVPSSVRTRYNFLGRSQHASNQLFAGRLSDIFISGQVLTDDQVAAMISGFPSPRFASDPIVKTDGFLYQIYNDSIADVITDADVGEVTFSKLAGPAWLAVDANGRLSGTPGLADVGANNFAIRAGNSAGASAVGRLTITVTAQPQLIARYAFEGNTRSSVGPAADGTAAGFPAYDRQPIPLSGPPPGRAIVLDGRNNFVTLPRSITANCSDITLAAWVRWNGGGSWQRIFDLGNGTGQYLFMTPRSAAGLLRFAIKNGGAEQALETSPLPIGQWNHVAVTINGNTGSLYVNGVLAASSDNITIHPSDFDPAQNYIGKSQYPDPLFNGLIDEFLIYNYALSSAQIAGLVAESHPPVFISDPIGRPDAIAGRVYSNTIEGAAADGDLGDTLTYSKVSGPSWLIVAADGRLSGTPSITDVGTNNITVRVTDKNGLSSDATLVINIPTGPPAAPLKLIAKSGYAQVNLTWTSASRATSYIVKRSTTSGGPYVPIAGSILGTSFSDATTGKGTTTHYYVVSAVNSIAESAHSIEASATPSASATITLANPGFEEPATPGFIYNPTGSSWTFSGIAGSGSGVAANNSGFTQANPNAPEGVQVAFIQGSAIISQPLSGFIPGETYVVAFSAAQRTRATQLGQTWDVRIDGVMIGSFAPPQTATNYSEYTVTFTASATAHTLEIAGTNINGGDNTIFLDNVRITKVP
jgi:Glycosyl hydrolase catalytic core/Concanavalin A-like lectin/glucanases superfamily/Putative Ig domain